MQTTPFSWTVIIPATGKESNLRRTLRAMCRQQMPAHAYEILVVNHGGDSGGPDKVTHKVIQDMTKQFPDRHIRLLHATPPGLLAARHLGAAQAHSEIFTFVTDNVSVGPNYGQYIMGAFLEKTVSLVGGPCLPAFEAAPPDWLHAYWNETKMVKSCTWLDLFDLGRGVQPISPERILGLNFSIRRQVFQDLGGFHPDGEPDERQMFQGDGVSGLTARAGHMGCKAMYLSEVAAHHIIPAEHLTEEYIRSRAFSQGVSDSYADIRRQGSPEGLGFPLPRLAADDAPGDLFKRLHNAHVDGYLYHQQAVKSSPVLLGWVLRPDYFSYEYPELESNLPGWPRDASRRLLTNPGEFLGDVVASSRYVLRLADAGYEAELVACLAHLKTTFPNVPEMAAVEDAARLKLRKKQNQA